MPTPFDPITLPRGLTVPNRIVLAPMTTYASLPDGNIDPAELPYLQRRAEGGFGLVITAACYVHSSGHAFKGQWACSDDEFLPSLKSVADAIREGGGKSSLQIHHGGRSCPGELCGGQPISASDIPFDRPGAEVPRAMTEEEIVRTIADYAAAALRAKKAGFDSVEIHGANTYLLQQFVSPHSNRRTDDWGQDRLKFPLAVTDAVLAAVGDDFPIGYRFSPEEVETPGIRIGDTEKLIDALLERPLSWLHISLRDYKGASMVGDFEEPTLARIAQRINHRVPFIGVGGIKTLEDAQAALDLGADMVALARLGISEPEWPKKAFSGEPIRQKIRLAGMEETLTIPPGLARRLESVTGWFETED